MSESATRTMMVPRNKVAGIQVFKQPTSSNKIALHFVMKTWDHSGLQIINNHIYLIICLILYPLNLVDHVNAMVNIYTYLNKYKASSNLAL